MVHDVRLKEALPGIVDRLATTYVECPDIHHFDQFPFPNRDKVIHIIDDLREVLFPGFGRRQNLHMSNVEYYVGHLLVNLHDLLTEQIARAERHKGDESDTYADIANRLAQLKTIEFLDTLPDIRRSLAEDVQAAYDGDPAAVGPEEIVFSYPGLEAIMIYRVAHELHQREVPLIPRLMTEYAHSTTGIDIHPGARIGRSFFIDHGTGVVIGETCDIGDRVKLYQGVTLGAVSFPKDTAGNIIRGSKRHPTLENDVVVYANATILGGETVIGHHSVVGSSVWLTSSVDPYTMVTMEKPNLRFRGPQPQAPGTDAG